MDEEEDTVSLVKDAISLIAPSEIAEPLQIVFLIYSGLKAVLKLRGRENRLHPHQSFLEKAGGVLRRLVEKKEEPTPEEVATLLRSSTEIQEREPEAKRHYNAWRRGQF